MLYQTETVTSNSWKVQLIPDLTKPNFDLPQIIDEYNLCAILGYSGKYPWYVIHNTEQCYLKFWVDKDTKRVVQEYNPDLRLREINAPTKALKELHGRLAYAIFNKLPKHDANFAYMKGKNIKMAADAMVGNDVLIRIDLKDFFPSHRAWYIKKRLQEITGYSEQLCWFMSRLCCLDKSLPQGAVTSPVLSIVLNYEMDDKLQKLAQEHGLVYTRYADDLCFSGSERNNAECWRFIKAVQPILRPFKINWDKVAIMRNKAYSYTHAIHFSGISLEEAKTLFPQYIVKMRGEEIGLSKLGHEEMYEAEIEIIRSLLPQGTTLKLKRWYIQSIQRMLGLNLTNGVRYPRDKYKRMRLEAMLVAKGADNINPHKFQGRLSFMRMVDPEKASKIEEVLTKWA